MNTAASSSSEDRLRYRVDYAGQSIALHAGPALVETLRAQLQPFFSIVPGPAPQGVLELQLCASALPEQLQAVTAGESRTIKVDTSLYAHLASDGQRWELPQGHLVRIALTGSCAHVQPTEKRIALYQPSFDKLSLDATRLLKGLMTVFVESSGGIQLHSSAVTAGGTGVLLLGDMWQGKTTLLLELLREFEVQQVSCDTVCVVPDAQGHGGIAAHGWPSPFSVSHGTLADHPALYEFFPAQRRQVPYDSLWREGKKSVLTSEQVTARFGTRIEPSVQRIGTVLVIRFDPQGPVGLRHLEDSAAFREHVRKVYLGSRDPIYHPWHGYARVDDAEIDRNVDRLSDTLFSACDVVEMTWAPSAVSLLKRLPSLGRTHKDLARLLEWP
jgi:hypothetical protein